MNTSPLPWRAQRVMLRSFCPEDLHHFHGYRSDPRVAQLQGWEPHTLEQSQQFVDAQSQLSFPVAGQWQQLAVVRLSDQQLIGDVGIWLSEALDEAEFGLSITHDAQGQGYGREVCGSLLELIFSTTPVTRVIACTDRRNRACIKALQHAGMQLELCRQAQYKGETCEELQFVICHDGKLA
ncbi:GNAT family N-acetyltransferase [Shewanella yunxiaonensis]|uniref:GNAT family N-acetyltransferase n=1 Tax=Shewanella yunxiaonensis TaxID=2829809 RepID=A0ABX7YY01_9GAMM|nr:MULTISPECIES: GNAT family N-acetyltransferase [Shewanella]MDF0535407.1 GNAT family N-acetyltransferase [Shewanella sp. A32]QUN07216.1 GNAT family N-acetyltransferase [Shewanella yunxiaonensis]